MSATKRARAKRAKLRKCGAKYWLERPVRGGWPWRVEASEGKAAVCELGPKHTGEHRCGAITWTVLNDQAVRTDAGAPDDDYRKRRAFRQQQGV